MAVLIKQFLNDKIVQINQKYYRSGNTHLSIQQDESRLETLVIIEDETDTLTLLCKDNILIIDDVLQFEDDSLHPIIWADKDTIGWFLNDIVLLLAC